LRFGWQLYDVPSHCVCGTSFGVDHAMVCCHGGLTFIHHNELCDLMATWLHNVAVEPPLLPLNGEAIVPASAISVMKPVQMFVLLGSGVDVRVHFLI